MKLMSNISEIYALRECFNSARKVNFILTHELASDFNQKFVKYSQFFMMLVFLQVLLIVGAVISGVVFLYWATSGLHVSNFDLVDCITYSGLSVGGFVSFLLLLHKADKVHSCGVSTQSIRYELPECVRKALKLDALTGDQITALEHRNYLFDEEISWIKERVELRGAELRAEERQKLFDDAKKMG